MPLWDDAACGKRHVWTNARVRRWDAEEKQLAVKGK